MTADLLADIGRAQLAASVLILLVLAVRRPVRNRVGARTAYGLWLLPVIGAAASLLPSRVNRVTLAPVAETAAPASIAAPLETMPDLAAVSAAPLLNLPQALLALWVIGVIASVAWVAIHQVQCRAWIRHGTFGPAVIGFWRPRVVLPADFEERYSEAQRALILEHEAAHLRRQDPRIIGLALVLRALAWFNPLAYVALRKLRIDQELACDETVLTRFPKVRRAYAETLAKSQLANRPLPLGCYWPSGTEHPFLERIAMIRTTKVGARRRLAGGVAIAVLCAASGLAAWAANPAETVYEAPEPAPVVEVAATPAPRPAPAQPPAPAPAPKAPESKAAAPTEVCLTNACAEAPAPVAAAPEVATCSPLPCRVEKIGRALIPNNVPFARYFDGNAPVLIKGKIAEVMLRDDGISSEVIVVSNEDGKRWRVIGGSAANMPADVRAEFEQSVGSEVVVRAYQAHDKSCEGACIANGRSVTRPDGSPLGGPPPRPPQ